MKYTTICRRSFIKGLGAAAFCGGSPAFSNDMSLRQLAESKKMFYGSAAQSQTLIKDRGYSDLLAKQANILVAEGETKRNAIEAKRGQYNFAPTDSILQFARRNGQSMRGHTLLWHDANPAWLPGALEAGADDRLISDYIGVVAKRYRGRFQSWDVCNEVVKPDEGSPDGLRKSSIWYKAFGERYIDIAFHAAKEADPEALLFLNENNIEADDGWSATRRTAFLNLIDRLQKRNVPVEAIGIQAHLKAFRSRYSDEVFSKFLDEIAARGLKMLITEFDVADIGGPWDPVRRDTITASLTKRFLEVAFSKPQMLGCLTWGITNKYSWLSVYDDYKWPNGQLSRSLPFDENFRPTPMFDAMAAAYSSVSR